MPLADRPAAPVQPTPGPAATPSAAEPVWELATLFPNQGHWTEQEYLDLPNNRRVEFFRGHIQVLPVATQLHRPSSASCTACSGRSSMPVSWAASASPA